MSRLIDADANREKFKKIVYQTLNDCNITTNKKFNIIMTAFDNIPTAFDVEKVVEELEEEKDIAYADFEKYANDYFLDLDENVDDWYYKGLE